MRMARTQNTRQPPPLADTSAALAMARDMRELASEHGHACEGELMNRGWSAHEIAQLAEPARNIIARQERRHHG